MSPQAARYLKQDCPFRKERSNHMIQYEALLLDMTAHGVRYIQAHLQLLQRGDQRHEDALQGEGGYEAGEHFSPVLRVPL